MRDATVLVPHLDAPYYLHGCIEAIKKFEHPEVDVQIIIADQSQEKLYNEIVERYAPDLQITVIKLPRVDAGYPIDVGCQIADGEYFCSLDCDAQPIHRGWLHIPITMIERHGYTFVGNSSGLGTCKAYQSKGEFFHINNYYRVSTTSLARELSLEVGFMRPNSRAKVNYKPINNDWGDFPCDNGVVTQWYSDRMAMGPKLSLALNKIMGHTTKQGAYGTVVEDLIFHMVFGFAEDTIPDFQEHLGDEYLAIRNRIIKEGLTPATVQEFLTECKPTGGARMVSGRPCPGEIELEIEELKKDSK